MPVLTAKFFMQYSFHTRSLRNLRVKMVLRYKIKFVKVQ